MEAFCVAVFTVEYSIRLATTPSYRNFIFSFFDTIDLLSILPFYVEVRGALFIPRLVTAALHAAAQILLRYFKMDVSGRW